MDRPVRATRNRAAYQEAVENILAVDDAGNIRTQVVEHHCSHSRDDTVTPPSGDPDNPFDVSDVSSPPPLPQRGRGRPRGRPRGQGRGRGRGRGQTTGGEGIQDRRAVEEGLSANAESTEEETRMIRDRQYQARLAQNEKERQARDIDAFFEINARVNVTPIVSYISTPLLPAAAPSPLHRTAHRRCYGAPMTPAHIPEVMARRGPSSGGITPRRNPFIHPLSPRHTARTPHRVIFAGSGNRSPVTTYRRPVEAVMARTTGKKQLKVSARDIWPFFARGSVEAGTLTRCKLCPPPGNEYSTSTSTTTLRRHLGQVHPVEYLHHCQEKGLPIKVAALANKTHTVDTTVSTRRPFSSSNLGAAILEFVVANDLSLRIVDTPEFRNLLLMLRESLTDADIIHRTALRNLVSKAWDHYFEEMQSEMNRALGKISLTTDIWDDKSMRAYSGVTAHYFAKIEMKTSRNNITSRGSLIGFLPLPGRHCGTDIANALLFVTDRAKITEKILCVTTDGASNMSAALQEFSILLAKRGIIWDSLTHHCICMPHRLHTAVTTMVKHITKPELAEDTEPQEVPASRARVSFPEHQTPYEALRRDPLARLRGGINDIRGSQLRRHDFKGVIAAINCNRLAQAEATHRQQELIRGPSQPIPAPSVELIKDLFPTRDIHLRWMSLFEMGGRGLDLREVSLIFILFTDCEWGVIQDIVTILEPACGIQKLMCTESTPVISFLAPFFHGLIVTWENMRDEPRFAHLSHALTAGLDKLEEQYGDYRFSKPVLISIVLHPALRFDWLANNWPSSRLSLAKKLILEELRKYDTSVQSLTAAHSPTTQGNNDASGFNVFSLLYQQDSRPQISVIDSLENEWKSYCLSTSNCTPTMDLVAWWQDNANTYPRLYRMAMDYLPAQASSVPAERVFSSSGETDTRRRNRISPHLMEQLQMLKYMMRKARLDFTSHLQFDSNDAEAENEFIDRGLSINEGGDAFNTLLDLLADDEGGDLHDPLGSMEEAGVGEGGEVFHFDDQQDQYSDEG